MIIWVGYGIQSKILTAGLIAFFPILVNVVVGLKTVEPRMLLLMRALKAGHLQTFIKVRLPSMLPYLFAGLETAIIFAVIGAIVGEFIGASQGLGQSHHSASGGDRRAGRVLGPVLSLRHRHRPRRRLARDRPPLRVLVTSRVGGRTVQLSESGMQQKERTCGSSCVGRLGGLGLMLAACLAPSDACPGADQARRAGGLSCSGSQQHPQFDRRASGFFKEEGLQVEVRFSTGGPQATQITASGGADVGQVTQEPAIEGYDKGIRGKMFYTQFTRLIYHVAVPADSAIQSIADLKGKKIGVSNMASASLSWRARPCAITRCQSKEIPFVP